jgi:hypothetical protein
MIAARTTTRRVNLTKLQAAHSLLPRHRGCGCGCGCC